jgi:hypothetical protein
MLKPYYKNFYISVTEANKTVKQTFELDKSVKLITALGVESNRDDLLYYRGSQRIEINKEEIFPEGYSSKRLMSGLNVSPNRRSYKIRAIPTGNGLIKIEFADGDDGRTVFAPYIVSLVIEGEREDTA